MVLSLAFLQHLLQLLFRLSRSFFFVLLLPVSAFGAMVPLVSIDSETINHSVSSGNFSWNASYDVGFDASPSSSGAAGAFNVGLDILLFPVGGFAIDSGLVDIWEQGIESIWSGQFQISHQDLFFYDVNIDVNFVSSFNDPFHHYALVHQGSGAMNLTNWYTENPSGWSQDKQDEAAAHEVGHMFGNYDEYAAGAVNPDGSYTNVYDSLMGSGLTQTLFPRHYQFIVDWVGGKAPDTDFEVVSAFSSSPPPLPVSEVPLPATWLMFCSALVGLYSTRAASR